MHSQIRQDHLNKLGFRKCALSETSQSEEFAYLEEDRSSELGVLNPVLSGDGLLELAWWVQMEHSPK